MLDQILKLLHPFMPFITEELWDETGEAGTERESLLMLRAWPTLSRPGRRARRTRRSSWLIELVTEVRSVRSEMNVPPAAQLPLVMVGAGKSMRARA